MIRMIDRSGYRGDWSFEVFNDDYVQMPVEAVAQRATPPCGWQRKANDAVCRVHRYAQHCHDG